MAPIGTFVLWGLFFAVFLILEKGFLLKPLQRLPVLSHLYTLLLVAVSFVIFDSAGLSEAAAHLGRMVGAGGVPLATGEALYYLGSYAVTFIIAIIGATPYPTRWMQKLSAGEDRPCYGGSSAGGAASAAGGRHRLPCGWLIQSVPLFPLLRRCRCGKQ